MEKVFEWKFPPLSTFAVCYCEIVSADDYWVQLLLLESLMSDRISSQSKQSAFIFDSSWHVLTDGIFKTGAYGVPSKSQNLTIFGEGGPSSTQCSNPSWAWCWRHPFGTNNYPPFWHSTTKNQVFIPALDFLFFAKIRLETANIWCGVSGNLSEQEWWCQNGTKVVPRV